MPRAVATAQPRPLSRAAATRLVRGSLTWDKDEPARERDMASTEARRLLHDELNDRVGLLRVLDALERCPFEGLAELQRLEPFASHPAGLVALGLFESHLLGAASGGVDGPYGRTYLAEIAAAGPYVRALH